MASKWSTLTISDGDTPEWIKFEWKLNGAGTQIKAILDLAIDKSAKNWDSRRQCWFISADVAETFITAVKAMIGAKGTFKDWIIEDLRTTPETIENFENFFESNGVPQSQTPKTQKELAQEFIKIIDRIGIQYSITDCDNLPGAKPLYRKAALILHPDRNNGDGSKMSELNMIWAQLEPMLK